MYSEMLKLQKKIQFLFSGRCENGNPCDQTCFNLHDFMYECDCNEGFYLHSNGYNCIGEMIKPLQII